MTVYAIWFRRFYTWPLTFPQIHQQSSYDYKRPIQICSFAEDTSVVTANLGLFPNSGSKHINTHQILIKHTSQNLLLRTRPCNNLNISNGNKLSKWTQINTLGLQIKNRNWKTHTKYITPEVNSAYFAMWTITPLMQMGTLKLVYFSYCHPIMSHVAMWGNSADSNNMFDIQKKIITMMAGV